MRHAGGMICKVGGDQGQGTEKERLRADGRSFRVVRGLDEGATKGSRGRRTVFSAVGWSAVLTQLLEDTAQMDQSSLAYFRVGENLAGTS